MAARDRVKRFAIVFTVASVVLVAATLGLLPGEPTYKGATMHEWLARKHHPQQQQAILTLGTNNFPLLLQRLALDPKQSTIFKLYIKLPRRLAGTRPLQALVHREIMRGRDAQAVLRMLGPSASPVIPQLTILATGTNYTAAYSALFVLDSLGDQALPTLASLAQNTNRQFAYQVLARLAPHTNCAAVRQALTNALSYPDPWIQKEVQLILTGEVPE